MPRYDKLRKAVAEKKYGVDHRVILQVALRFSSQQSMNITVGVLALQGAFVEHITLLKQAANTIAILQILEEAHTTFTFLEIRSEQQLSRCDALIIPGGESTTISLVAARSGLLEPLRDFVK